MSPMRIREMLETTPFRPFTVYTGDGTQVNILSKEFAWLRPGGRTLLVSVPLRKRATEETDFEEHNIDVFLIAKVTTPPKRASNGNRRSGA